MEEALGIRYWYKTTKTYATELNPKSVGLVRYADDFVVFCHTKEQAEEAREKLKSWLAERGLQFSDEKTRIVNLDEGFDFLGFNVRQYKVTTSRSGYRLLIKPSKKSVQTIKRKLKLAFRRWHGFSVDHLIGWVNPIIRGWANYFRTGVSSHTFQVLDDYLFKLQVRWVKRQHPNKPWKWIAKRYWSNRRKKDMWVFGKPDFWMSKFSWTSIKRHTLVRRFASWDDPDLEEYWDTRMKRETGDSLTKFQRVIAKQQGWVCLICGDYLNNGEEVHEHHAVQRKDGGSGKPENLQLVHLYCHQTVHLGS